MLFVSEAPVSHEAQLFCPLCRYSGYSVHTADPPQGYAGTGSIGQERLVEYGPLPSPIRRRVRPPPNIFSFKILFPTFYRLFIAVNFGKRHAKSFSKLAIRDERDIHVDCFTADGESIL